MSPETAVLRAIARAERILPGIPAREGKRDARWQAIIRVGEFIETQPEKVWQFAHRWGKHAQADLRMAVATCLLEHLLEHHFELLFPHVRRAAMEFGQAKTRKNAARITFENCAFQSLRADSNWTPSVTVCPRKSRSLKSGQSLE